MGMEIKQKAFVDLMAEIEYLRFIKREEENY